MNSDNAIFSNNWKQYDAEGSGIRELLIVYKQHVQDLNASVQFNLTLDGNSPTAYQASK